MTGIRLPKNNRKGAGEIAAPSVMGGTVRMLCLDLDGTLLTDEKKVAEEDRRAVRYAYRKGAEIVLATGRQYRKAKEFAGYLDVPVTIIGNNGASIRDAATDRRIYFSPMPSILKREVIEAAQRFGIAPIVHVDRYEEGIDIVISRDLPPAVIESYGLLNSDWVQIAEQWNEDALGSAVSMVFFGTRKEIARWRARVMGELLAPHVMHHMSNLQKFEAMLEILGDTGTKWHGILYHAGMKRILPHEIMAIGDDDNDIEMLRCAGYSYAPQNATPQVQAAADRVLSRTNNEGAVANAIYEVLA